MRPSRLTTAAVHVDLATHALADAQVPELSLLEVGVDPDLRKRADGHQALPHLDVVTGVHATAGDHAVDLADDIAVAEVQLGLRQVAAGLEQLGLGLLDARRIRDDLFEDALDVPAGLPFAEVSQPLLGREIRGGHGQTDLNGGLDQGVKRRADCGKGLFEISRYLGQVVPLSRLGGEAEVDPGRVD